MFYGQRKTNLFSFAFDPLSLSDREVEEIRDILIEFNANKDFEINERLNHLDLRIGSLNNGIRRIYRIPYKSPIDSYHILDTMGNITLVKRDFKPLKINLEKTRFSPGSLYDMEEKERERD